MEGSHCGIVAEQFTEYLCRTKLLLAKRVVQRFLPATVSLLLIALNCLPYNSLAESSQAFGYLFRLNTSRLRKCMMKKELDIYFSLFRHIIVT